MLEDSEAKEKIVLNNIIPLQQAHVGFFPEIWVFALPLLCYTFRLQLKSILTSLKNSNNCNSLLELWTKWKDLSNLCLPIWASILYEGLLPMGQIKLTVT